MRWAQDEFTGKRFGKYEVLCRLAIGGMAEIFLGFARTGPFVGRPVVLKRILNEQREDPQALQMLIDEAKLTATLSHPNVAQVFDLEVAGEEVLLVIEFIQGCNLEELVDIFTQKNEVAPLGFALGVIREAAQGLGHAHLHKDSQGTPRPIVHRDVTPRNIMVDFEGTTKMLDFGIARAMGGQRRTVAGMVRGTTAYMSPEQAIGKDLDPRTDLFSMGVIFHELLTGQRLFARPNPAQEMAAVYESEIPPPSKVNRRVPKNIDPLVMKLLERPREKRYQTATDFVRDLGLAASSMAWGHDRCAEVIRERFAERRQDIGGLLRLIPARELGAATEPGRTAAPPYPEGRTVITKNTDVAGTPPQKPTTPRPQPPIADEEGSARTLISQGPVPRPGTRPPANTEPVDKATDPGHHRSEDVVAAMQKNPLSEAQLFGDLSEEPAERTRIIPGGSASKRSLPNIPNVSEVPTDPRRSPVRRGEAAPSSMPLVLAAVAALVLGAVGGAFIYKQMGGRTSSPSIGRLTVTSDRPAMVVLSGQAVGKTPIENLIVPAGRLALELQDDDGVRHGLEVDVAAAQLTNVEVKLDSLRKLP